MSATSTQRIGPPQRGHVSRSARKTWARSHDQRVTWWGSVIVRVVVAAEGGKAELITASCRRPSLGRVVSVSGYNFAAQSRVARKNPEISEKMRSRRRH